MLRPKGIVSYMTSKSCLQNKKHEFDKGGFHLVVFSSVLPFLVHSCLSNRIKILPPAPGQLAGCMQGRPSDLASVILTLVWRQGSGPAPGTKEKQTPSCLTLVFSSEQWCPRMTCGQMWKEKEKTFPSIQKETTQQVYKLTAACCCWPSQSPFRTAPADRGGREMVKYLLEGAWKRLSPLGLIPVPLC